MKRRLFPVLLLLLLFGGLLFLPQVHWPIYGWMRAEPFYQGMSASWWASEIEAWYQPVAINGSLTGPRTTWQIETPLSFRDRMRQRFGPAGVAIPVRNSILDSPLFHGELDAGPVLLGLIRNESAKVRRAAATGMMRQPWTNSEIVTALRKAAQDSDEDVRLEADRAVTLIDAIKPVQQNPQ